MDKFIAENPATKRILLGAAASALAALNQKFGLGMSDELLMAILGLAAVMITGSNWKEAKMAGAQSAAAVVTNADAAKELAK